MEGGPASNHGGFFAVIARGSNPFADRSSSLSARFPSSRVAPRVHAGHDHDGFAINTVEDPVRKLVQQCAPSFSMEYATSCRIRSDALKCRLNGFEKPFAKPGELTFVPPKGLLDFGSRCRTEEDRHYCLWPRTLRSTSSQGMPMGPSRSSSSSRRSSSSRCAFVNGIASGVVRRLSQSSSRRRKRSSALRLAISIGGMR
jgi:hypothetical protein